MGLKKRLLLPIRYSIRRDAVICLSRTYCLPGGLPLRLFCPQDVLQKPTPMAWIYKKFAKGLRAVRSGRISLTISTFTERCLSFRITVSPAFNDLFTLIKPQQSPAGLKLRWLVRAGDTEYPSVHAADSHVGGTGQHAANGGASF